MPLVIGQAAPEATGMLSAHSEVFQALADETRCVISSRVIGKYAANTSGSECTFSGLPRTVNLKAVSPDKHQEGLRKVLG